MGEIMYPTFHKRIAKACALVAATTLLPVLAYADHDTGKGHDGHKGDKGGGKDFPSVPDGGPGILLLTTTIGAVLFFSRRQFSRSEA
jgi:hypothetical protein